MCVYTNKIRTAVATLITSVFSPFYCIMSIFTGLKILQEHNFNIAVPQSPAHTSQAPTNCLKPWIVPNPTHTMFSPTHTHL